MTQNVEARRLIAEQLAYVESDLEAIKKDRAATRRRASRLADDQRKTEEAIAGLRSALEALGGPPPEEVEAEA